MTYDHAIQFLYDLQLFGAKLGLENTRRLAELAGNPQEKLKFIHVAGTNGKGSVCAMLESIYRAAGFKTGLYASPHLIHFGERIQINHQFLSEAELVSLTKRMRRLLADGAQRGWWPDANEPASSDMGHPTFFEVVTVMALIHFADSECEIVLWETGMGGRLDATNIVAPLATVITNISLEHSAYLGDTIEKITAEKCGIIKPGIPVISGANEPPAQQIIREVANSRNARVTFTDDTKRDEVTEELFGRTYQATNAQLALNVIDQLDPIFQVSGEARVAGLEGFSIRGRLQRVQRTNQTFLIDGAHNPASMRALRKSVGEKRYPTVFGCFADKDLSPILNELLPLVSELHLAPVNSPRTADLAEIAETCRGTDPDLPITIHESLEVSLRAVTDKPEVLITGSLYLAGEALNILTNRPDALGEHSLNDWRASTR